MEVTLRAKGGRGEGQEERRGEGGSGNTTHSTACVFSSLLFWVPVYTSFGIKCVHQPGSHKRRTHRSFFPPPTFCGACLSLGFSSREGFERPSLLSQENITDHIRTHSQPELGHSKSGLHQISKHNIPSLERRQVFASRCHKRGGNQRVAGTTAMEMMWVRIPKERGKTERFLPGSGVTMMLK